MSKSTILACGAALSLLSVPMAFAQTGGAATVGLSGYGGTNPGVRLAGTQNAFFHAQQIIGTQAQNPQGANLGNVHDVIFNPGSGQIFVAINVGSGRFAVVPWQAVTVTSTQKTGWWGGGNHEQVVVNATVQGLRSGPSISGKEAVQQLGNPQFIESIYAYYNLRAPAGSFAGGAAVNGAGAAGGATTGTGAGAARP